MGVDPPIMQGSLDHFHPVVARFSSFHKADIKAKKKPRSNHKSILLFLNILH